ncbi:MAG TPA: 3D domain-containing protein [Pyrinomonadaceae bacterium]|nr:3D domain-containing protein [Pyrinomonadaceae bacterium]
MKITSIFGGGALACIALVAVALVLSERTLSAETINYGDQTQSQKQAALTTDNSVDTTATAEPAGAMGTSSAGIMIEPPAVGPLTYVATAYSLRGRTAMGLPVNKGLIAADPRVLPLGSRVRLDAGPYSGEYLVADTGTLVKGRRIDIWTPSAREAMRFGRRTVKLTILSYGGKRRAAHASFTKTN